MSTQTQQERLQKWRNGIKIAHNSHLRAAAYYTQRGRMLGVPVVILTTIIGTAVFTSIAANSQGSIALQVTAGLLSMAAAALSSLYTFLNYGGLAERHRTAAVKYGNLRREVEQLLCFMNNKNDLEATMENIRTRWDSVDFEAPEIPQKIHDKVRRQLSKNPEEEK
ncbi:MAG: SLATT domain-containing protein [Candidatus Bathyarchaeia archaeon]|jgi:hypothetical protein